MHIGEILKDSLDSNLHQPVFYEWPFFSDRRSIETDVELEIKNRPNPNLLQVPNLGRRMSVLKVSFEHD